MHLTLERHSYSPTETQGNLIVDGQQFPTIECAWRRGFDPGGKPFESCIPDGEYDLLPLTRPNGDKVFALVNPDCGVWLNKDDRPDGVGRYLILIHSGNTVHDVVGCIAPGQTRVIHKNDVFVTNSRFTMKKIMAAMDYVPGHKLSISPVVGAVD